MPIRTIPSGEASYHLVAFDRDGVERREPNGVLLSESLVDVIAGCATDVFLTSHGWKGDIPAAIRQYDKWIETMVGQRADRAHARTLISGFAPLIVGIHWPSLPWGDERIESAVLGAESDELAEERDLPISDLVDRYAERIADTDIARAALHTIVESADSAEVAPTAFGDGIQPELAAAYETLFTESGLRTGGVAAAPGTDQDAFVPAVTTLSWIDALGETVDEARGGQPGLLAGDTGWGNPRDRVLAPVRQLSFWTMKHRALRVGENGVHRLLSEMQRRAPQARFHLMGHSFGCIVMAAAVAGPSSNGVFAQPCPRPVDSLFLVQGAMSLWSFSDEIPFSPPQPGYFETVCVPPRMVRGSIVTTRSIHDRAVGTFFPIGAKAVRDRTLDSIDFPEYGAIGAFGAQGVEAEDSPILAADAFYDFQPGHIYNIDASSVISHGRWPSGAHSDIAHPAVAHIFWQVVLCGV